MTKICLDSLWKFLNQISHVSYEMFLLGNPGFGLGDRASMAICNYKSKWQPAQQSGKDIVSWHRQPIIFVIEE